VRVPEVAVIVAVPLATAVTNPDEETVATPILEELQVTTAPFIVAPFWSLTVAVSCCVAPKEEKLKLVADSVIEGAVWVTNTVTDAVALTEPDIAIIVAVPLATAVTNPDDETVATPVLDELHDTLAPFIVTPIWSLTVALSCCVAPKEEKLKLVGDSVIEVATGLGGVEDVGGFVGEFPPSPHARSKSTTVSRMWRISPRCVPTCMLRQSASSLRRQVGKIRIRNRRIARLRRW
jgi:hypothetical protein